MGETITSKTEYTAIIVGAGLAGLSAAIHLAKEGIRSRLVSSQPSERAQSVLAAGGINGALNTMGESDRWENHFQDTMKAGCDIADPEAVRNLTENAPDVILWLDSLGVPFQRKGSVIQQRNFGGQKKKRTAYSRSSTGKVLMSALIDEARKYEAAGMILRYPRHDFVRLILNKERCTGLVIRDRVTGAMTEFSGPVLMACGGLNGLFPGRTTGTTANSADAAAMLFVQGVTFSNLEMIQYHPTTLGIPDKRLLVSEAARGEGGRLFIMRGNEKWYFMEEKYPELGNLMPRDVVSREEYFVMHDPGCKGQVYLDCTGLSAEIWKRRLPDLRKEVMYYTKKDPVKEPIAIEPGIHYFMGGIDTDTVHRASFAGLYAAGECCSLYHGANRLGGNSMLGAIYGGKRAAQTIAEDLEKMGISGKKNREELPDLKTKGKELSEHVDPGTSGADRDQLLGDILYASLGVARDEETMRKGLDRVREMLSSSPGTRERARMILGEAVLESALFRKESRGAQYRTDYPKRNEAYCGTVTAQCDEAGNVKIGLRKAKNT